MKTNEELLPCPFCGWEHTRITHQQINTTTFNFGVLKHDYYEVKCDSCFSGTRQFESRQEAIKSWNTRQDKWLPISDAPDDMEILITGGKYQSICSGSSKWIKTNEVYLGKKYKGDNYYTIDDYFKVKNPTHFQYLPIPPKGE